MNRLQRLLQERAALVAEAAAIGERAEAEGGRAYTAEEASRDDAIAARLDVLNTDITREERRRETARTLGGEPVAAGSGLIIPDGMRVEAGSDRAAERPWASLGEQLQAAANAARNPAEADVRLRYQAAGTGLNSAVGSEGGYLLQREYSTALLARARENGVLAPRCRRIPVDVGTEIIDLPYINETSRAAGSRWGGVQVYRAAEAASVTATMPALATRELRVHELRALCYATDRILRNAAMLESIIQDAFASEFAVKLDSEIMRGTGAGEALGLLNAPAKVTVSKESAQAAATLKKANIDKMWARFPAALRNDAVWLINQDVEPQLDNLSQEVGSSGGVPVYLPAGGIADAPYSRLKGRPVIPVEHCSTLGTEGDIMLVSLKEYLLLEQGAMQGDISIHYRFINHESTFRFSAYVSGEPIWRSALTPMQGSNTLSPYVVLETRA